MTALRFDGFPDNHKLYYSDGATSTIILFYFSETSVWQAKSQLLYDEPAFVSNNNSLVI